MDMFPERRCPCLRKDPVGMQELRGWEKETFTISLPSPKVSEGSCGGTGDISHWDLLRIRCSTVCCKTSRDNLKRNDSHSNNEQFNAFLNVDTLDQNQNVYKLEESFCPPKEIFVFLLSYNLKLSISLPLHVGHGSTEEFKLPATLIENIVTSLGGQDLRTEFCCGGHHSQPKGGVEPLLKTCFLYLSVIVKNSVHSLHASTLSAQMDHPELVKQRFSGPTHS